MNLKLLSKLLGLLAGLIGAFMILSLPWAAYGGRTDREAPYRLERDGFNALMISILICFAVAGLLYWLGRKAQGRIYRKEAMAAVGLSWLLATALGSLPYILSNTYRAPSVRVFGPSETPLVVKSRFQFFRTWHEMPVLEDDEYKVVRALCQSQDARGLSALQLHEQTGLENAPEVFEALKEKAGWSELLTSPNEGLASSDRASNYRIRWALMTVADALFESQSGFSTTGASVLSDLEDTELVPQCIVFWRSSTHFLGGLGIIVLFVALLGQGSSGKMLMRAEMPGPSAEGAAARMQQSAWVFAGIYIALNLVLSLILMLLGMSLFDALCHAFGTMATGGFSTYNDSLGHFDNRAIEYTVIVFMILAGTNFTLLYLTILRQPGKLLADVEWRTYIGVILAVTAAIIVLGMVSADDGFETLEGAFRYGLFQVVSVITTTGYGTHDFDAWNQVARLALFVLMFVGGCAGSTGGGMKVVRHVLFGKILWIETEKAFHPRVVRPLRVGGLAVDEPALKNNILVYFGLVLTLFVFGWLALTAFEPNDTWRGHTENKLIDSASSVAATLNNIGPGLGVVGPTHNYGSFTGISKILFVWLMMFGRLEVLPVLVLFAPSFWRDQ